MLHEKIKRLIHVSRKYPFLPRRGRGDKVDRGQANTGHGKPHKNTQTTTQTKCTDEDDTVNGRHKGRYVIIIFFFWGGGAGALEGRVINQILE